MKEKNSTKEEKEKFSKDSLVNSKKYSNRKDLLGVLLENDKQYTFEQVDALIEKFMKGKVK